MHVRGWGLTKLNAATNARYSRRLTTHTNGIPHDLGCPLLACECTPQMNPSYLPPGGEEWGFDFFVSVCLYLRVRGAFVSAETFNRRAGGGAPLEFLRGASEFFIDNFALRSASFLYLRRISLAGKARKKITKIRTCGMQEPQSENSFSRELYYSPD